MLVHINSPHYLSYKMFRPYYNAAASVSTEVKVDDCVEQRDVVSCSILVTKDAAR